MSCGECATCRSRVTLIWDGPGAERERVAQHAVSVLVDIARKLGIPASTPKTVADVDALGAAVVEQIRQKSRALVDVVRAEAARLDAMDGRR